MANAYFALADPFTSGMLSTLCTVCTVLPNDSNQRLVPSQEINNFSKPDLGFPLNTWSQEVFTFNSVGSAGEGATSVTVVTGTLGLITNQLKSQGPSVRKYGA